MRLHFLSKYKTQLLIIFSWSILVAVFGFFLDKSISRNLSISLNFPPDAFQSVEITSRYGKDISSYQLSQEELHSGFTLLPGSELLSFKASALNTTSAPKEITYFSEDYAHKKSTFILSEALAYNGSIKIPVFEEKVLRQTFSCLLMAIFFITPFYLLAFIIKLKYYSKKSVLFAAASFVIMLFHLIYTWPGLLSYDFMLNQLEAYNLDYSSYIQPFTSLLNAAFLNFYPSYIWQSLFTISLMAFFFGVISFNFLSSKNIFFTFIVLYLYFFINPLNIYANLFINRDTLFSWIFLIATIFPLVIHVTKKKDAIGMHLLFLFFFFMSVQVRKEVAILFPFALVWSLVHLTKDKKNRILLFSFAMIVLALSLIGTKDIREENLNAKYQTINLLGPVLEILSEKGTQILSTEEKRTLSEFLDIDKMLSVYLQEDISQTLKAFKTNKLSDIQMFFMAKLYLRLMKDYPLVWIKDRFTVLMGSFGLNSLNPLYAYDVQKIQNKHVINEYVTRITKLNRLDLTPPALLQKWKQSFWENRNDFFTRYVLLSFAVPIACVIGCLFFLRTAPLSSMALAFHVARLITITPFMPASYLKYNYTSYVLFLFLPILVMAERKFNKYQSTTVKNKT